MPLGDCLFRYVRSVRLPRSGSTHTPSRSAESVVSRLRVYSCVYTPPHPLTQKLMSKASKSRLVTIVYNGNFQAVALPGFEKSVHLERGQRMDLPADAVDRLKRDLKAGKVPEVTIDQFDFFDVPESE